MIREVARHAGVSLGTVSRVINEHPTVNAKLRARVQKAIRELGYRPNVLARSLRKRRSHSFGLVIPDVTNPFFAELVKGVEQEAWKAGYTLILGNSEERPEAERIYIEMLIDRMVDGLIVVPSTETKRFSLNVKIPLVLIDRSLPGYSLIASDHRNGASSAVGYLIDLGHRRIACIAGPQALPVAIERFQGYQLAMKSRGLKSDRSMIEFGSFDYESGYKAAASLLDRKRLPTAIFASSDQQAIGAIRAATDRGLNVPRDLSVIGFDDIPLAALFNPRLSTVKQSIAGLSRQAVSRLLSMQDEKLPPIDWRLETSLVLRESCAPLE